MRWLLVVILLAGCAVPAADPVPVRTIPPPVHDPVKTETGYVPFEDVEPYTSEFFISLEGTGLAEAQGERRLYNLGVRTCERLDDGGDIGVEVAGLRDDAGLGDSAGALIGSAVAYLCPKHRDQAQAWVDANR